MSHMQVKLDQFQGPLDLLLHLIKEQEVAIEEISIAEITDQYLAFVNKHNIDQTSEFAVMASQLLAMKAKAILPPERPTEEDDTDDVEIDPRQQLVERLLEYQQYKKAAGVLADWEKEWSVIVERPIRDEMERDVADIEFPNLNLENVMRALHNIMQTKPVMIHQVSREPLTVEQRMAQLREFFKIEKQADFVRVFEDSSTRGEVIVTFLALLELCRSNFIRFESLAEDPMRFHIILQEEVEQDDFSRSYIE